MTVEQLFDDLLVLLDGPAGPAEAEVVVDEPGSGVDAILAAAGETLQHLPQWAHPRARDYRGAVVTTSDQYVVLVELQSRASGSGDSVLLEGIGDTGATRTLLDIATARRIGLPVEVAKGAEFGTYFGPGSAEKPYAGRVAGPVVLNFGREVSLELKELKLIHHPEPLFLIGADVLCGGRAGWTYRAMGVGAAGKGMIIFANGKRTVSLPLVNAPVLGRPRYVS